MEKEPLDGHLTRALSTSGFSFPSKHTIPFLFLSFLYIYLFHFDSIFLEPYFQHQGWSIEVTTRFYLFPLGILLFWRNQKIGWYILVALLSYNALSTLYMGIQELIEWIQYDPEVMRHIYTPIGPKPPKGIIYYASGVLINLICIIIINQRSVMEKFALIHYSSLSAIIYTLILFSILVAHLSLTSY